MANFKVFSLVASWGKVQLGLDILHKMGVLQCIHKEKAEIFGYQFGNLTCEEVVQPEVRSS